MRSPREIFEIFLRRLRRKIGGRVLETAGAMRHNAIEKRDRMDIHKYFSRPALVEMRRQIKAADGNEVFFTGMVNANGIVTSAKACARGRADEVPINVAEARECSALIHNHPSGNLEPSDADMAAAQDASERGQGFYIINNDATAVYVVMEPVESKPAEPLDVDKAAAFIEAGGPLSRQSSAFEDRPAQADMLRAVARAFNENLVGAFEAGTGVGKSYAYLIPALLWADRNGERVVISTGTINLQQQLCQKDIPAAEKIIGKKIKFILLKGRQNYICLRRLSDAGLERDFFDEDMGAFDSIAEWAETTETGSKSDLSFVPPENVWSRVRSESDACMGARCPFHAKCFVMKVRKEAAAAKIIVVNHHLLFADIESRMNGAGYDDQAVLPPYKRVIFDEAHGIESSATSFFSETVSRFSVNKQVNLLYRRKRNLEYGYICDLAALASSEDKIERARKAAMRIKGDLTALESAAADLMGEETSFRLRDECARDAGPLISTAAALASSISELTALVKELRDNTPEEDKSDAAYWEAALAARRLDSAVTLLNDFSMWDEKRESVFWMQRKRLSRDLAGRDGAEKFYVALTMTPLDVAPLMNGGVFEPMESVVCASATLSVNGDMSWWMKRNGLLFCDEERLAQGNFPSPFPYETNLLLAVPSDAPFPDSGLDFQRYTTDALVKLLRAAGGRTLALFTSYDSLRASCDGARAALAADGINILRQGEDDNARILARFREDTRSALFATDSFWQGVDVPGESLSQVVIVKLPFSAPNDSVFAARAEALERHGGNSFMELSLPEAVIKFRQGFGRLIRRSDDRGAVVALDRRIHEKRYGKMFLSSVPKSRRMYAPTDEIASEVKKFLDGGE